MVVGDGLKSNFAVETKIEAFFTGKEIQFSRDGSRMFCGCNDVIKVLNIGTGKVEKTISLEESDAILTFVLSPDDKILVTVGKSGLLKHWNWEDNACVRTWKSNHVGPIVRLNFDSTSTLVASGGSDSTIKVWDILRLYCTHSLKGAQGVCSVVHFHPDISRLLIFGTADDCIIHAWDLKTSQRVAALEGHYSAVTGLAFIPDGNEMLSCGRDKVVLLWDIVSFQLKKTIPVYETLESIVLLPKGCELSGIGVEDDGHYFLTAGDKGILRVWSVATSRAVFVQSRSAILPEGHTPDGFLVITHVNYIEALNVIAVVTHEHDVLLFKTKMLSVHKQFIGYNDDILDVQFLGENDTHVAISTNSEQIKVFELSSLDGQLLHGHTDIVLALATFSSNPNLMASAAKDNSVRLWLLNDDTKRVSCVAVGHGHTQSVGAVACYRLTSKCFVSGSQDTCLKLWDVPQNISSAANGFGKVVDLSARITWPAHEKDINSLCMSPNDKLVATASQDKLAKLWSLPKGSLIGTFRGHRRGIWSVTFSPVDQALATSSADGTVRIWNLTDFSCLKTFEGHESSVLKVLFMSRGTQLLTSSSDGIMKLWTIKTNECIKSFDEHTDKVWGLATNKDESLVASAGGDSMVIIWKDVTEQEALEEKTKQETMVLQEQKLANLLHEKKYAKALALTITLEQPFKALNIIKDMMLLPDGCEQVKLTLDKLREDQLEVLVRFAATWNMNSKHCYPAQIVLNQLLNRLTPEKLLELTSVKTNLEAFISYTGRHYQRLCRLMQQATFVDYMWQCMKMTEIPQEENLL